MVFSERTNAEPRNSALCDALRQLPLSAPNSVPPQCFFKDPTQLAARGSAMGSPPPSRIAPSVVVLLMPPFQRLPAALLFVLRTRTPRPPRPSFASTEGVSAINHWLLKYSSPLPLPHSPGAAFPGLRLVGPGRHKGLLPHLYNQDTSNDFP